MSTSREFVLKLINAESSDEFFNLLQDQSGKNPSVDVAEVISELGQKQSTLFWQKINNVVQTLLPIVLQKDDKENCEVTHLNGKAAIKTLVGIASVMVSVIRNENVDVADILPVCHLLHDAIPTIPSTCNVIVNHIVQLCELWWNRGLNGRESVILQAMLFLMNRSLQRVAKVDIKRVYLLKNSLKSINLGWRENDLLLKCATSAAFLHLSEGRKFISFVLTLSVQHLSLIHAAIKNKLTSCSSLEASYYGDVYHRAWSSVPDGELKLKLEVDCIQNLMDMCIHGSSKHFASTLRKVLGHFHHQKNQFNIRKMLVQLYEPILWRSLKVANCCVRENSAEIFFDTFPLESPDLTKTESDQAMQKQLSIIEELLYDPSPSVRCIAIMGVCRICNVYWEMIPFSVVKSLLMNLVDDLSVDAASLDVRFNVCKGFAHLLENPICHAFLKEVLPQIAKCFNDISEKVRVAFVDLLILLKGLKTIKFWKIIPPNELLCRLAVDSSPVARRIVLLLFDTYHPIGKGDEKLLDRSLTLITSNRNASRAFYIYSHLYMDMNKSVHFMLLVLYLLRSYVKREIKKAVKAGEDEIWVDPTQDNESDKENGTDNEGSDSSDNIDLTMEHIGGLFDAVIIMWQSIKPELEKDHNKLLKKKLDVKFSKSMSRFFKVFKNTEVFSSVLYLASLLPSSVVQMANSFCLARLREMSSLSSVQQYGIILDCLCNWGRSDDVLDLILNWLNYGLRCSELPSSDAKSKKKIRQKVVRFKEPNEPQPCLALIFVRYLVSNRTCCDALIHQQRAVMCELLNKLMNVQEILSLNFSGKDVISDSKCEFLVSAFVAMCEVAVILHNNDEQPSINSIEIIAKVLDWIESHALPAFDYCQNVEDIHPRSAKRNASQLINLDQMQLIILKIAETAVSISCNMLIIGIMNVNFATRIANFCQNLLEKVVSLHIADDHERLKLLTSVLYTISHLQEYSLQNKQQGEVIFQTVLPKLLITWLKTLSATDIFENNTEEFLPRLRTCLLHIIQLYQKTATNHLKYYYEIMAALMAAVMADVTKHFRNTSLSMGDFTVNSLPFVASLILLVVKRSVFLWDFINELIKCVQCGVVDDVTWYAAASAVLCALKTYGKVLMEKWNVGITNLEKAAVELEKKISRHDQEKLSSQLQTVLEFIKCLKIQM